MMAQTSEKVLISAAFMNPPLQLVLFLPIYDTIDIDNPLITHH